MHGIRTQTQLKTLTMGLMSWVAHILWGVCNTHLIFFKYYINSQTLMFFPPNMRAAALCGFVSQTTELVFLKGLPTSLILLLHLIKVILQSTSSSRPLSPFFLSCYPCSTWSRRSYCSFGPKLIREECIWHFSGRKMGFQVLIGKIWSE